MFFHAFFEKIGKTIGVKLVLEYKHGIAISYSKN